MQPTQAHLSILAGASVSDDMDALEVASGDAPYLLDDDDIGPGICWIVADLRIEEIVVPPCNETQQSRSDRLDSIRMVPPDKLFRPIIELRADGSIGLIDGAHRLEVAKERGQTTISVLVKCSAAALDAIRSAQVWAEADAPVNEAMPASRTGARERQR